MLDTILKVVFDEPLEFEFNRNIVRSIVARLERNLVFNAILSATGLVIYFFYFLFCTVHIRKKSKKLIDMIFNFDVTFDNC